MRLHKLTPRLYGVLGLELFVFGTFIGICAIINAFIVDIPDNTDPTINFIIATSKILISLILIAIWLYIWYYITKRLMFSKEDIQEVKRIKREKKQAKMLEKKEKKKDIKT
jgi:phosphotransferase system  glucose/maltose/N-acetylglucosamine-specific IIC component